MILDSNGFTGEGDIHLFGEMLNRFFALYVDMNQFNQLTLIVQPEGKCIRWKENHSPRLPKLMERLGDRLPYINFTASVSCWSRASRTNRLRAARQVRHEPVRFRPHPGMGFPASEIRSFDAAEYPHLPPTVRITFMGLYGVESPLPTHYIDDITQRRKGTKPRRISSISSITG